MSAAAPEKGVREDTATSHVMEEEEIEEGRRDLARTASASSSSGDGAESVSSDLGSDYHFASEWEEIPSFRWMSPSFRLNHPPPIPPGSGSSSSEAKPRPVVADAWRDWLPALTRGWRRGQRRRKENSGLLLENKSAQKNNGVRLKLFTFRELKEATKNFSGSCILGQGGYGRVYMGILQNQKAVAIKRLRVTDERQREQFRNEVFILTQVVHRNIIRLLGCCLDTQDTLLVYEFVPNGTLYQHIHGVQGTSKFSWETRLRIATEIATALAYLHSATSMRIIHRNIKSSKILLDENYEAKVSGFDVSWSTPFEETHVLTPLIQGTVGYVDPEYLRTCLLTEKSDVYSFGVILVELLLSEKPISLDRSEEERSLAWHFILSLKGKCLEQVLDAQVLEEAGMEHLYQVAELARRCLSLKGEDRPTMKEIALELEELRKPQNQVHVKENTLKVDCSLIGFAHPYVDDTSGQH